MLKGQPMAAPFPLQQPTNLAPLSGGRPQGAAESNISNDLTIIGNVTSTGSVRLDGSIEGNIFCTSLIVTENGRVNGGIVANQEVTVLGRVNGTIRGRRVMLQSSAHVEGDIFHQGIGIEMGTRYDGTLRWTEDGTAFDEPVEALQSNNIVGHNGSDGMSNS